MKTLEALIESEPLDPRVDRISVMRETIVMLREDLKPFALARDFAKLQATYETCRDVTWLKPWPEALALLITNYNKRTQELIGGKP